jgi:hypothetical protein
VVRRALFGRDGEAPDPLALARELADAGLAAVALTALAGSGSGEQALRGELAPAAERQLRDLAIFELNEGTPAAAAARARQATTVTATPAPATMAVLAECLAADGQLDEAAATARAVLDAAPGNERARRLLTRLGLGR